MYRAHITFVSSEDSDVPRLFEHFINDDIREICCFKAALFVRDFLGKEVSFVRVSFGFVFDA